jgi:DNA-binding beta-propeller fold protein YncE
MTSRDQEMRRVNPHNKYARSASAGLFAAAVVIALAGCDEQRGSRNIGQLDKVWGRQGISDGRLQRPRAITIDDADNLYIVDMTARIQVFTPDGEFLRGWSTPDHEHGRPTGLGIDRQGNILVADTHYNQLLIYSSYGELLRKIGGVKGAGPGEYGFVTDAVQDLHGFYYISEYGDNDRIHKVTADGQQVAEWGGHGSEPGQFSRPQALAFDADEHLWVADACNHRIQVFDTSGKLLKMWGEQGGAVGQLSYPYGIALDGRGHIYVCEFGNHRVQKFTLDGKSLGTWGSEGRGPGELYNPWSLALDHEGRLHVLDTYSHRVQRVRVND